MIALAFLTVTLICGFFLGIVLPNFQGRTSIGLIVRNFQISFRNWAPGFPFPLKIIVIVIAFSYWSLGAVWPLLFKLYGPFDTLVRHHTALGLAAAVAGALVIARIVENYL